ncbi:hypothetical protein HYV30_01880 [Candidatus Kaiserbacteria bacterium]|nr:hypothetical protein [Candidatus Kaiserbacteria bacterium]
MKFPNMDDVLACLNQACANAQAGVLPNEAYALLSKEGDEVLVKAICPVCAADMVARGIPVEKITDLVARSTRNAELAFLEKAAQDEWDARGQVLDSMSAATLHACRVPGCMSGPEVVSKMSAVIRRGDDSKDVIVPVCPEDAEKAKSAGVEVRNLQAAIDAAKRAARNLLLFEEAERRKALVTEFFGGCKPADRRGTSVPTRPVRFENGFANAARVVVAGGK